MNFYIIKYGLGGGFGGARNYIVIKATNLGEAGEISYEYACDEYEQYSGSNGLRDEHEIMQEDEVDGEEALLIYNEERESWLEYAAYPWSRELEERSKGNHYDNQYSEITDKM